MMTLFQGHGVLMAAGWVMAVAAIAVAATQRRRRWWLRLHRGLGLSAGVAILCGAAAAVAAVTLSGGEHLRSPHTWLGATAVAAAVVTPLLGLLQFRIRGHAESLRVYHRICGRLLAVVALVALLFGLRLIGYL